MKIRTIGLVVGALVSWALGGCSGISVWSERDPTASFAGLTTYDWAAVSQAVTNDPHAENPILDARVRHAVEAELAARGFEKQASGTPDFLVGYHVAIQEKLDVRYVDDYYGYSYTYRGRVPRKTYYAYEEGTLILDVSTPNPKRLIWRAIARAEVQPGRSQEQEDERLAQAVRKMLDQFPAQLGPAASASGEPSAGN
ncbi:MAG: DUF4136 domain-containing protein [Planctomycetota bacterium]|jgi:hypothetical protein